jgi:hypothetical protein
VWWSSLAGLAGQWRRQQQRPTPALGPAAAGSSTHPARCGGAGPASISANTAATTRGVWQGARQGVNLWWAGVVVESSWWGVAHIVHRPAGGGGSGGGGGGRAGWAGHISGPRPRSVRLGFCKTSCQGCQGCKLTPNALASEERDPAARIPAAAVGECETSPGGPGVVCCTEAMIPRQNIRESWVWVVVESICDQAAAVRLAALLTWHCPITRAAHASLQNFTICIGTLP